MLARFAFAAIATALLVFPVAAEPPASTAARSKEQVKIEVRFITVADDFFDRIGVDSHIKCNGENMWMAGELDEASGLLSRCPGCALLGAAISAGAGTLAGAAVDASQTKKAQQNAQAAAAAAAARAPSLTDIVNMTQNDVPTSQIVEQIRTSGVVYRLTADQIIWLNREGVDPQVINALQDTDLRPVRPVYTAPKEPIFLDDKQLHKFLESLQADVRTNFADAIKTIVSDGKTAVWRRTRQHLRGTSPNDRVSTGYKVAIQPTVVADYGIALKMKLSLTSLDAEKPLRTTTLSLKDELIIPAGHTVLLGGWKQLSELRHEYGPPVGSIPYLSRLFPKAYKRSTENILILVTATIVDRENK